MARTSLTEAARRDAATVRPVHPNGPEEPEPELTERVTIYVDPATWTAVVAALKDRKPKLTRSRMVHDLVEEWLKQELAR